MLPTGLSNNGQPFHIRSYSLYLFKEIAPEIISSLFCIVKYSLSIGLIPIPYLKTKNKTLSLTLHAMDA